MSNDDIWKILGGLLANMESMQKRVARMEAGYIAIGVSAVGVIVVYILKQAGLF